MSLFQKNYDPVAKSMLAKLLPQSSLILRWEKSAIAHWVKLHHSQLQNFIFGLSSVGVWFHCSEYKEGSGLICISV